MYKWNKNIHESRVCTRRCCKLLTLRVPNIGDNIIYW